MPPYIKQKTLSEYLLDIEQKKHFSFTRYWDGEMACMVGREGMNCDSAPYSSALREHLKKTISNNYSYYHSIYWPYNHEGTKNLQVTFDNYLQAESKIEWFDAMIWQRCFEAGNFHQYVVNALQDKNILFVAGEHIKPIQQKIKVRDFIPVHDRLAFDNLESTEDEIVGKYENGDVIIFCAGMASNCMIDDLFPIIGQRVTMLDMGSVWDAYLGYQKRQWIRRVPISLQRKSRGE
jgi:hypothetical protein